MMHHHFSFYLNARRIDYFLHTNSIDHMINFSHDCDCQLSRVRVTLILKKFKHYIYSFLIEKYG